MCSLPAGQLACCRWVRGPLTDNRSNRVGNIHTYWSFSAPHYAAPFPDSIPPISTETHGNCETVRQTDVVQQRVCELKVEMGFRGAGTAGDHAVGRVGRGGKALVKAGEQPLQLTSTGRSCPIGYWLAFLLVGISVRHQLHHLVSIGQKTNLLRLLFSLLSQLGSVGILDML